MKKFLFQNDNPAKVLFTKEVIWRLFVISVIIQTLAIILGFAFLIMAIGFNFVFLRLAFYWKPANQWLNYGLRIAKRNANIPLLPPMPWYVYIPLFLRIPISVGIIGFGIHFLFEIGFCDQNLFCHILIN